MCAGLHLIPRKKQIVTFWATKRPFPQTPDVQRSIRRGLGPQGLSVLHRLTLNRLIQEPVPHRCEHTRLIVRVRKGFPRRWTVAETVLFA